MGGEPGDQTIHARVGGGDRGAILASPAVALAREIGAGAAEIGQSEGGGVERMQIGQGFGHRHVKGGAVGGREVGQGGIPEQATVEVVHHEEGAPERRGVVGGQRDHPGHRHRRSGQRRHDATAVESRRNLENRPKLLADGQHIRFRETIHTSIPP